MQRPGSANPWENGGIDNLGNFGSGPGSIRMGGGAPMARPGTANPWENGGLDNLPMDSGPVQQGPGSIRMGGGAPIARPGTANPWENGGLDNLPMDSDQPKGRGRMARPQSANPWENGGLDNLPMDQSGPTYGSQDPPMDASDQIQFIVSALNETLGMKMSLVAFDGKKGRQLVQLLNDVFAHLSPDMKQDLSMEDPNKTVERMAGFLTRTLNYKVPPQRQQEFLNALFTGDENGLYPIFAWVLKRMPENAKRVYLAKYLMPVQIPEDMCASDDGLRDVFNQYKHLIEQFKMVHKTVDSLKAQSSHDSAKTMMSGLEKEKEQLTTRVEVTKRKMANFPNHQALFQAAQKLRLETIENHTLMERMNEQQSLKAQSEQRIANANRKLDEISRDFGQMNIDKMIRSLQDEVSCNEKLVKEKLPKQLAQYHDRVNQLQAQLTEHLDPDQLHNDVYKLENEIKEIEDKARPKVPFQDDSSLGLFRQQAALVVNRKEKFVAELEQLKEARAKLEEEQESKEQEFRGYQGSKILKGEEFKAYANTLRGKSNNYKRLKAELQDLKSELGILQRTEEMIGQQASVLDAKISEVEKKKGIDGYRGVKDGLVSISETKMEVDEAKGKTLEELSKVVQEFVANIRNKRNKLAPQILELRNTRQKSQAVEQEYQQKKEIYDANAQELEDDISKISADVDAYTDDWKTNESLFHRLNCQIKINELQNKRVQDEKEFKSGARKLNDRYKTYSEMLDHQVGQLEGMMRDLRERKKDIEENHDTNLQQMRWFKDLHKLLECKLTFYQREAAGQGTSEGLAGVDMAKLGVDRLVL